MPTGYTALIIEGDGVSFEEFAWSCARPFGALVMMRDDGPGAKIPERFEPTPWHTEKIAEAKARLAAAEAMTDEQAETGAEAAYQEAVAYWTKANTETDQQRARYEEMLRRVIAWEPPTPDHVGMKDFMRTQIEESIRFDCDFGRETPVRLSGADWRTREIELAQRDIAYHEKAHREEIERVEGRNAWLAALRSSVPMPEKLKAK